MNFISAKADGCVIINGQPYQIGDMAVKYTADGVHIRDKNAQSNVILEAPYTQMTVAGQGVPFASLAAMKTFIQANFFVDASGEGGGGTENVYVYPTDFGAIGDGVADDAAALNAAIATGKPVHMGGKGKVYKTSTGLVLHDNQVLFGDGAVIYSSAAIAFVKMAPESKVIGVRFLGAGGGSGIGQDAVLFTDGCSGAAAINCIAVSLGSCGYRSFETSTDYRGNLVANCEAYACKFGINADERGEYTTVTGGTFNSNDTNLRIQGGNTHVTGANLSKGLTNGVVLAQGHNDAHGSITGGEINHCGAYAVRAENINTPDFSFNGVTMYYGDIYLSGCRGVKFNHCTIVVTNMYFQGAVGNYFNQCDIQDINYPSVSLNIIPNFTTPSKVIFTDCIWPDRVAIDSDWRINGALLEVTRATDYTIHNGLNNQVPFDSVDKNMISCNPAYTLDNFYDSANNAFDYTKKVSPRRSPKADAGVCLTIGSTAGAFSNAGVEVLMTCVTTGEIIGAFTEGKEQGGLDKYRIYSYNGNVPTTDKVRPIVNNTTGGDIKIYANSAATPTYAKMQGF